MKFRLREGFNLFKSMDESIEFETRGLKSGVRPVIAGGQIVDLSQKQLSEYSRKGVQLGKFEPIDDAAIAYFGDTTPIRSRVETDPHLFARVPEKRIVAQDIPVPVATVYQEKLIERR
jgi:hypothetical protein